MGWLFRESALWVVLAGLLGAAVTWFLMLRKVTLTRVTEVATSSRAGATSSAAPRPAETSTPVAEMEPELSTAEFVAPAASVPEVEVPAAEVPAAEVPEVSAPEVEVPAAEVPEVEVPEVEVPDAGLAGGAGFAAAVLPVESSFGVGSADPLEGGGSPHEAFTIKGNADSMLYHTVESPYYGRTVAEVWFDTEEHARAGGFTRWDEREREPRVSGFAAAVLPVESSFGVGSADPLEGGGSPHEAFTIKGNADSMLYHTVESPYYGRTVAEVWFDTEEHAQAAGFTRWDRR
jgi:hypothetical protein